MDRRSKLKQVLNFAAGVFHVHVTDAVRLLQSNAMTTPDRNYFIHVVSCRAVVGDCRTCGEDKADGDTERQE